MRPSGISDAFMVQLSTPGISCHGEMHQLFPVNHRTPSTCLMQPPFSPQVQKGFWKPPPQFWFGKVSQIRILDPFFLRNTAKHLLDIPLSVDPKSKKVRAARHWRETFRNCPEESITRVQGCASQGHLCHSQCTQAVLQPRVHPQLRGSEPAESDSTPKIKFIIFCPGCPVIQEGGIHEQQQFSVVSLRSCEILTLCSKYTV